MLSLTGIATDGHRHLANSDMQLNKLNWVGLAGGVATLVLVIVSVALALPWWQLTLNQQVGQANLSALNFSFQLLGNSITVPLIWFMNLTCQLPLLASAIAIIIYSIVPTKSYSKHLLGFAYKRPLITLILFVVSLLIVTYFAGNLLRVAVPLAGSTNVNMSVAGATINVPITTGFTWVFWLAVTSSALCIGARLYRRRIAVAPELTPVVTTPPPASAA